MERSRQRWNYVCNGDWVETYDFLTPEQKRVLKLQQFLQSKDSHRYENARPVEVLKIDGEQAFVRATAVWTPQHPMLAKVKLEPGQTLTQELEMIETWRWGSGDWYYLQAERPSDFYTEHPEFLKKAEPATPAATKDGAAEQGK